MELDSHADTCALAQEHCALLQDTGKVVTVEGFGNAVQRVKDIPIVTAAVAYDCPITYSTFLLVFHEALLVPRMKSHLINPLQLRHQGLIVNEAMLQHLAVEDRKPHCHSIILMIPTFTSL